MLASLIASLSRSGVQLNLTAIMTLDQVARVGEALAQNTNAVVSVFAGASPTPDAIRSL